MSSTRFPTNDPPRATTGSMRKTEGSPLVETRSVISRILANGEDYRGQGSTKKTDTSYNPLNETNRERMKTPGVQPAPSVSRMSVNSRVTAEDMKRLYDLQLNLLSNPSLLAQTQAVFSAKTAPAVNVEELTKERNELSAEVLRLKKQIGELEFGLNLQHKAELAERDRVAALTTELESVTGLKTRLEQAEFEVKKLAGERDFHQSSHLELRKQISSKAATDFAIAQLKRELFYKSEEVEQLRKRNIELEETVSELMLFAEKPRGDSAQNTENFFAKKIVELESQLRRARDERAQGNASNPQPEPQADNGEARRELLVLKAEVDRLKKDCAEIPALREENQRLRSAPSAEPSEEFRQKVTQLSREKTQLQLKIDDLALQLSQKQRELLQATSAQKPATTNDSHLVETNKKLMAEVNRLQEQLRKIDNLNKTSLLQSNIGNRSQL